MPTKFALPRTTPLILHPGEVAAMDQDTALAHLIVFCILNHFTEDEQDAAFALLQLAAVCPGLEVTYVPDGSWIHIDQVHDCAIAITCDPTNTAVAAIALGAPRGTTWQTRAAHDYWALFATATMPTAAP